MKYVIYYAVYGNNWQKTFNFYKEACKEQDKYIGDNGSANMIHNDINLKEETYDDDMMTGNCRGYHKDPENISHFSEAYFAYKSSETLQEEDY